MEANHLTKAKEEWATTTVVNVASEAALANTRMKGDASVKSCLPSVTWLLAVFKTKRKSTLEARTVHFHGKDLVQ